jgi:nickel superoxide dismutase
MALNISNKIHAHCEVPCGIFTDSLRIELILEHITTIEKAMNQINSLSKSEKPNYNQLVRWITNKELHAEKIQHIVSQYFLHQRIKIADPTDKEKYAKYQKELELLHKLLVYSMKTKQNSDLSFIEKLRKTVDEFSESYFHDHHH